MRKKIYIFFSSLVFLFSFSGCATTGTFDRELISKEINPYYNKVNNTSIMIYGENKKYETGPSGFVGAANTFIVTSDLLNFIEQAFFEQYFNKVIKINSVDKNNITIHSSLNEFTYKYGALTGTEISMRIRIKVYKEGNLILNREYQRADDSKVIVTFHFKNRTGEVTELIHKTYLDILETEFKKDLLEALSANS